MSVGFRIDGPSQRTLDAIKEFAPNVRQAIRQTFFRMGRDLKSRTNRDILDKSTKTGREYPIYDSLGRKRIHRASAPFQTHANLTGKLRLSIGWQTIGTDTLKFGYGLTRPMPEYGPWVEFGTRRMKPRPSLQNNIKKAEASFEKYFAQALAEIELK